MTWYPQTYVDKVDMTDMNMRPNPTTGFPGRTYRFYKGPTVFSFGDGMSYTTFTHELVAAAPPKVVSVPLEEKHACRRSSSECKSIDADAVEESCKNLGFNVNLRVKNEGKMRGSHTVFLFSSPPNLHNAPHKQLIGFQKLHLEAEGEGVVRFDVDVCKHLSVVDENGKRKLALGDHLLHVGNLKHSLTVRI